MEFLNIPRKNPMVKQTSSRLYANRDKTGDIKFKIDGEEIPAHKCILAAFSPEYYERQFYGFYDDKNSELIELKDVSAAAFKEFLQFFYLDEVCLTHKNIEDVIKLADKTLVKEFYDECFVFLAETLSIENVCQTYYLAELHQCRHLVDRCKNKIKANSKAVFATDGFKTINREVLLKILQLDSLSCRETDVFEAFISWAKQYCVDYADDGKDPNKNEDLREALGDLLYEIRFGAMTIKEFMGYFKAYKTLFTDEEREEIFSLIGEVEDFKPKLFTAQSRGVVQPWSEKSTIECNRIYAENSSPMSYFGLCKTIFSCNREVLLGSFYCGALFRIPGCPDVEHLTTNTTIIEKRTPEDESSCKVLFTGTKKLTFQTHKQACVELQHPILIKPDFFYEIQIEFVKGICLRKYELRNEVVLDDQITVQFQNTTSPITCLKLSLIPKETENSEGCSANGNNTVAEPLMGLFSGLPKSSIIF